MGVFKMSVSLLFCCLFVGITVYGAETRHKKTNTFDAKTHPVPIMKRNSDVPELRLYYECKCHGCREFDSTYFAQLVSKLGPYLDIHTYPYGKASTTVNYNGTVEFTCQHGPVECHGNMLHACALDIIKDRDQALTFNGCLMEQERPKNGSNYESADECGVKMGVDAKAIKYCVERGRGVELLRQIGEESIKANYTSLPHLLINGKLWTGDNKNLIKDVCATFKSPPEACRDA